MVQVLAYLRPARYALGLVALTISLPLLAACSAGSALGAPPVHVAAASQARTNPALALPAEMTPWRRPATASSPITHVVIAIQENRSFNNLFVGFPNATTSSTGLLCDGNSVPLHPVAFGAPYDLGHGLTDFNADWRNGTGNCFNHERFLGSGPKPAFFAYAFVPKKETKLYWSLASTYTIADQFFASNLDASFTAHQYLIAGKAKDSVDIPNSAPWGCDGPSGILVPTITQQRTFGPSQKPCFGYNTLATELDAAGLTWRFYAPSTKPLKGGGIWSAFDAIAAVRNGPEWSTNVISPETTVLSDIAAGQLANVTWIVPDFKNSDHSDFPGKGGPEWITSIVDAVGASPFWSSTAIFVLWDDWGGWYDPVVPQYLDYDGLGFRVPLIVVSPYALPNNVAHTQYEFGSMLRWIENNWSLGQLAPSDMRATPFGTDIFNFSQAPRRFKRFGPTNEAERFIHEQPSLTPPDGD